MLWVALCVLLLYTVLHEAGHALMGLLFGGTVTGFRMDASMLTAQVAIDGDLLRWQRSLISVAGISLPLLVWVVLILHAPQQADPVWRWMVLIGTLGVLNSLLPWIAIPLFGLAQRIPGDDVTIFLDTSQIAPSVIGAGAIALYVAGWAIFLRRIGGLAQILALWQGASERSFTAGASRTLLRLTVLSALTLIVSAALYSQFGAGNPPDVPPGYARVASANLSEIHYEDTPAYEFTLTDVVLVDFYILLQNIDAGPAAIRLTGPQGMSYTLMEADETFHVGRAGLHPQDLPLGPGTYAMRLRFPQAAGRVWIYQSTHDFSTVPQGEKRP